VNPVAARPARTALAIASLVLVATACGGGGDSSAAPPPTAAASTTAGTAPSATGQPASAADVTVTTAESSLGTILVDGEGRTLYLFTPDAQGPSTCTGECLGAWPALLGPATAGDGADAGLLATAARPDDGTMQVTYDGWPLYYFAKDAAPGDVGGQGLNGKWYVVDPSGRAVDDDAEGGAPSTTSDRGGYGY
jgi:predicted lipoprotein with Yx(FWY)xxD motif